MSKSTAKKTAAAKKPKKEMMELTAAEAGLTLQFLAAANMKGADMPMYVHLFNKFSAHAGVEAQPEQA